MFVALFASVLNMQMSDGHQMMSSIEQHAEPSTTAKGLNSCKNRQHASNAKKSKKLKAAARDVSQALAPAKAACQERNGSVVITIRLLKMESAGSFDTDAAETRSRHASYLNNNSAMLGPQHECESALSTSEMSKNTKNLHANSGNHNQNNSFSVENNNVHLNEIEASTAATSWITDSIANTTKQNCDNSRNGQLNEFQTCDKHSIKMQHNRASLSEASICDNNQTYSTSQSEKPSSTADCLQHALKAINFADVPTEIKIKPDDASPFIPPTLIGSVSPYPHHIPIAIRSDCLNSVADERKLFPIILHSFVALYQNYYYKRRASYATTIVYSNNDTIKFRLSTAKCEAKCDAKWWIANNWLAFLFHGNEKRH